MRPKGKPSHSVGEEVEGWGPLPEWEAPDLGDWGAVTEDWNIDLPEWDAPDLGEWEAPEDWSIELPEWDTETERLPIYEKQNAMKTLEQMTREELEANVAALKNRLLHLSQNYGKGKHTLEVEHLAFEMQLVNEKLRATERELKGRLLP